MPNARTTGSTITLFLLGALLLQACGATADSDSSAPASDAEQDTAATATDDEGERQSATLALALAQKGAPWSDRIEFGARDAADEVGDSLELVVDGPAALDPSKGVEIFQSLSLQDPDAIVAVPLPPELYQEPARQAEARGAAIATVTVAPTAEGPGEFYVGENALDMGRAIGEVLADHFDEVHGAEASGTVVPGNCVPGLFTLDGRLQGVAEVLEERHPDVEVAEPILTGGEQSESFAAWDAAVEANPDALAFYDACEQGQAALAQLKSDQDADWATAAWDLNDPIIEGIKSGSILASVPQRGYLHGRLAVEIVGEALTTGGEIPNGWLSYPLLVVDQSNIDELEQAESSAEAMATYHQDIVEEILADVDGHLRPLEDALA